jgi:hypothetical protein
MPYSSPRQPGTCRPVIECLEVRQVPSALSASGHGHERDAAPVEAVVKHEPPGHVKVHAVAPKSDSSPHGPGHHNSGAPGKAGSLPAGVDRSVGSMDLPGKHSDVTPKSHKQEVDMTDQRPPKTTNSQKHATDEKKDASPGKGMAEQIEKALGDAQSLEDTIPLDVTRVIKSAKGQSDHAHDKAAKPGRAAAVDQGEKSKKEPAGPMVSALLTNSALEQPIPVDQTDPPTDDAVTTVHSLQAEPGRAARTQSRGVSGDASAAAGVDAGGIDPASLAAAPADTIAPLVTRPEGAGEPVKVAQSHASPFAIDLLMSTTASRATLALLATGLTGMDHVQGMPAAAVPPAAEPSVGGREIEAPARANNPVAGMGQEIAPEPENDTQPGTPVQSLTGTALGPGLDEVVGRVEQALDGVLEASSLRRLLPWLAGAGLAVAAVDFIRRKKSDRDQRPGQTVGADHDADTWLPRSITEKA